METLEFEMVTQEVETGCFDCGVDSINEYVRESYYPMILQHAYAYCVARRGRILGYYQIMFKEIELDAFPEEISDYSDEGLNKNRISTVHIRYIAVDSRYQGHKIGTKVLEVIIKNVRELTKKCPVRVITLDARSNLVGWYEKMGFKKMRRNTFGQDGTTEAMYFDCMMYTEELENYLQV